MMNKYSLFFAMLALFAGFTALGSQQILAAPGTAVVRADDDDDDDNGPNILVDNDRVQCPNAAFTSIQAAVTAAPAGATISVCPGTYPETVRINKRLTVRGIRVGNENLVVINPPIALQNTTSLASGSPIAAIVLVERTTNVTLENLTVDGAANLIGGCAPNFMGVYFRNASGKITNSVVRNIRLFPDALLGCQSGNAIFAQAGSEPGVQRRARLEVSGTSVHDYQKNGITANEIGTELTATGNAVTGLGSTPAIAQNGIQIAFGATGRIQANAIINHIYSLCVDVNNCGATSSNVLVFDTSNVKVSLNTLAKSQVNVYLEADRSDVTGNAILDSDVFDGVFVLGNNNKITANTIFNSDEAAVWIDGDNNHVNANTFNEAPIGVYDGGSSNNLNGNRYYNIGERVVGPAAARSAEGLMKQQSVGSKSVNVRAAKP